MRKPGKKYFSPSFGPKSIMMMRKWIASGASSLAIARWIKTEYSKATDDETRYHLGMMMCAALSSAKSNESISALADRCARMFGLSLSGSRTHGECAMLEMADGMSGDSLEWFENFNHYFVRKCKLPSAAAPSQFFTRAFSDASQKLMVTLDEKNGIYFFRDSSGKAWLMIVNSCNETILVDEEEFNDELPLYFTETSHFTSPVWLINRVYGLLDYVLMRIGYPPLQINRLVLFDASDAELVNVEDYIECPQWQDLDVVLSHDTPVDRLVAPVVPMVRVGNGVAPKETELDSMLYLSLMATSEILACFDIEKHADDYSCQGFEELCKKSCIFAPDNYDFLLDEIFGE